MAKRFFEGLQHAKLYSTFRPNPPPEIISKILSYMGPKLPRRHVVDVGCGAGQSTVTLSPHFQQVTGFDISEAQIAEAAANRQLDNIEYRVAPAEELPVANDSVEMITSFSSLHWFDIPKFLDEAKRILVPSGVLAIVVQRRLYPISENPEKNEAFMEYYSSKVHGEILKPYKAPQIQLVLNEFREINFPFDDIQREGLIRVKFRGTAADVVGYIRTTSFFQEMTNRDPEKAQELIDDMQKKMRDILEVQNPLEDVPLDYNVEYILILCRKPGN